MSDATIRLNAALQGRYAIHREIGEGGMATVFLAEDLRHGRRVAIKVLKSELAAVIGAKRFLSEIRTTAQLQHPHILPLFDSGEADGFLYYVMPLVQGESLRERLDRERQLPVGDAVRIVSSVAEALDYAHRQGVVHRDIKPANVLLHDGTPVVADFGIALAVNAAGADRMTETGLSLGTPHYMSPEQATGDQAITAASDIYSLGCLLYEMLVGEPPYTGSTAQAVLGKIVTSEPDHITEHRRAVPANVDAVVRRSLEKVPADRFTSAHDFRIALADSTFRHGTGAPGAAGASLGRWKAATGALTLVAVLAGSVATWAVTRTPSEPLARFPSPFEFGQAPTGEVRFTPDGSTLVYVGPGSGSQGTQLWVRRWAELSARPIRGTEGVVSFALSPDGRDVAFAPLFGPLRVLTLDGDLGRTLHSLVSVVSDWSPDGYVYFTEAGQPTLRLARIPARSAGTDSIEIVTQLDEGETIHGQLSVLPGGSLGVFQVWHSPTGEDAELWAIDLDSGDRWSLTSGSDPSYALGHLFFGTSEGVLMAQAFDAARGRISGSPVPVAEGLTIGSAFGEVNYAVSETGLLIYQNASSRQITGSSAPVWIDRAGDTIPSGRDVPFTPYDGDFGISLSPNGERLAFTTLVDGNVDVWVERLSDGALNRLTLDNAAEVTPAWSADGDYIAYSKDERGDYDYDIWMRRADGTGEPELLLDDERSLLQPRWSTDGEWMVFRTAEQTGPRGDRDIVGFRPGVDTAVVPLVATEAAEQDPSLSPNGRWLAYTSDRSGRNEVYVSPFPDASTGAQQVSTNGGNSPQWGHSGRELFFADTERSLVVVEVRADTRFRVIQSRTLAQRVATFFFQAGSDWYTVAPDDQRFLTLGFPTVPAKDRYVLVQNFFDGL